MWGTAPGDPCSFRNQQCTTRISGNGPCSVWGLTCDGPPPSAPPAVPDVNGQCGGAVGTCAAGTPGPGPASTWTCQGSGNGTNATCSISVSGCNLFGGSVNVPIGYFQEYGYPTCTRYECECDGTLTTRPIGNGSTCVAGQVVGINDNCIGVNPPPTWRAKPNTTM